MILVFAALEQSESAIQRFLNKLRLNKVKAPSKDE
jgi:hypothetical protein